MLDGGSTEVPQMARDGGPTGAFAHGIGPGDPSRNLGGPIVSAEVTCWGHDKARLNGAVSVPLRANKDTTAVTYAAGKPLQKRRAMGSLSRPIVPQKRGKPPRGDPVEGSENRKGRSG